MAALLWSKDNIGVFGGDAGRVTLSGHGTGAALVNLLMISPIAAGKLAHSSITVLLHFASLCVCVCDVCLVLWKYLVAPFFCVPTLTTSLVYI